MATSLHCLRALRSTIRTPSYRLSTPFPFHPRHSSSITSSSIKPPTSISLQQTQTKTLTTTTTPTTTSKMASKQFLESVKNRRTIYQLKKESPISDTRIQEIIKEAVLHVPSSFNAQSTRYILLLGDAHDKLWDIAREVLTAIVPAEQFAFTDGKLKAFKGGYATILFFVDRPTVQKQQETYAAYADKFPIWADQSAGMSQFAIWTALELEGLGANLQHYSPIIDAKVQAEWNVPAGWELGAQMVIGTPEAPAGEKQFLPVEERFLTYGA